MTQSTQSAAAARPAGVAEAPQVSNVLRRHIWSIIAGTVLCTAIAAGLWALLRKTEPRYTAQVYFQVLPQPLPPGNLNYQVVSPTQEEITRFIRRQILFLNTDAVLDNILQTDAFQHDIHDPTSSKRSQWLEDHIAQPKKYLKDDMDITPLPSSDVFEVAMTAKSPDEAANLVNAIARVYQTSLANEAAINKTIKDEQGEKAVAAQELSVKRIEDDLASFRKSFNIDAITPRYTLQLQVLGEIDKEYTRVQGLLTSASQQYEAIKAQVQSNTLQLTPDAQREVENDPALRFLIQTQLQLEQERSVAIQNFGPSSRAVKDVETRIATVTQQIAEQRQKAEQAAKLRMQFNAQSMQSDLTAQMDFLKKARDDKDREVRDLDVYLVQAQQKADALLAQQVVLAKLRENLAFQKLQSSTDDARVRRYGGDAVPPDSISWPIAWKFIIPGAALGLLLSFGSWYLVELTNTRVRTPFDITRTLQMPLLGFVPDQGDDSGLKGELSTSVRTAPTSMIAESFRQIRGRLIAERDTTPVKTLLVASISPGGGATTVASNIANGMALNNVNVLLVDANFYRPGLKSSYKNIPSVGLSDLIGSPAEIDNAIVQSEEMANLHLMGTGNIGGVNPAEMLESRGFRELLETLKSRYDLIVFDGAPLSLVSDSIALGARVDAVIAVVRAGEVSRGTVARVREQLRQVRAHFMGVVLNAAQTHGAGYFKENYRTFYKYAGQGARTNGATKH